MAILFNQQRGTRHHEGMTGMTVDDSQEEAQQIVAKECERRQCIEDFESSTGDSRHLVDRVREQDLCLLIFQATTT